MCALSQQLLGELLLSAYLIVSSGKRRTHRRTRPPSEHVSPSSHCHVPRRWQVGQKRPVRRSDVHGRNSALRSRPTKRNRALYTRKRLLLGSGLGHSMCSRCFVVEWNLCLIALERFIGTTRLHQLHFLQQLLCFKGPRGSR